MADQVDLRMRSQEYMREHPEMKEMLLGFVSELLTKKPQDTVEFAAKYFTDDSLPERLNAALRPSAKL